MTHLSPFAGHYSRRAVREAVENYIAFCETSGAWPTEERFMGIDGGLGDTWATESMVIVLADLSRALDALVEWEARHFVHFYRTHCLRCVLMAGFNFTETSKRLGCRREDVPVYVEEGLEWLYQFLKGTPIEDRSVRCAEPAAYGLQSLWDELREALAARAPRRKAS